VGILFTFLLVGSYGVWKTIGSGPSGGKAFEVWAKFRDASGLPLGSRVVIAGLPVGEISDLGIQGRYARIDMRIRDDIELWTNATVYKKSSSLLGDFFIEIDPGTPFSQDATGKRIENSQLENASQITRVIEAASPDDIIRKIDETIPKVDSVLLSVRDLSEDVRDIVNGPVKSMASRLDQLIQEESKTVSSILRRIDLITADVRSITDGGDQKINRILDNLDRASQEAETLMSSARGEIEQTGAKVRDKLDLVDEVLGRATSVATKIDENKGTLGRLVNDSTLADNLEDITDDAKGFLDTLFGMQAYVGLRSEYNIMAQDFRHYMTAELVTRPDKFYYIELEKGPRGDYPEVTLEFDNTLGRYVRRVKIEDKLRFTFQFAKRIDWLTLRWGLKESTGGIGADFQPPWFDNKLKVSVDVFDATFDQLPRLKIAAAYELFGYLYILGGVDELLNGPEFLPIEPLNGPTGTLDEPIQFDSVRIGRDYFFGAMLRFNDADLTSLLTVGGAALLGGL